MRKLYYYVLPKTNDLSDDSYYVVKAKNLTDLKNKGFNKNAVERRETDYDKAVKGLNPKKLKVWD